MHRSCLHRLGTALLCVAATSVAAAHDGVGHHVHGVNETSAATNHVRIEVRGEDRFIESNGIPDHARGAFPNSGNPNTVRAQEHAYRVPARGVATAAPAPHRGHVFGVALNGVPFDPGTAEFWRNDPRSGWNIEALSGRVNLGLDANNAHVQPTGAYHYHGIPTGLVAARSGTPGPTLVGWAADGFPIYDPVDAEGRSLRSSYRLKTGTRPDGAAGPGGAFDGTYVQDWEYVEGLGDLDECNGRVGVTPEFPEGTYFYVLTETFPFVPRMFRGTPDDSFARHGPPPGGRPGGPRGRRGPPPGRPPRR